LARGGTTSRPFAGWVVILDLPERDAAFPGVGRMSEVDQSRLGPGSGDGVREECAIGGSHPPSRSGTGPETLTSSAYRRLLVAHTQA